MAEVISKVIPVPVVIGNDADCAALGESVAGVGKDYQDMVMLRIGTGVGVGVLLDGDIFGGRGFGGSELGHMVIVDGGELCTCGRRGCLEAYASIAGLKREAMRAASIEMSAQQIYSQSKAGDMVMRRVVDTYIHRLGTGVVNVANGFRPQLVILGGKIRKPFWARSARCCRRNASAASTAMCRRSSSAPWVRTQASSARRPWYKVFNGIRL